MSISDALVILNSLSTDITVANTNTQSSQTYFVFRRTKSVKRSANLNFSLTDNLSPIYIMHLFK